MVKIRRKKLYPVFLFPFSIYRMFLCAVYIKMLIWAFAHAMWTSFSCYGSYLESKHPDYATKLIPLDKIHVLLFFFYQKVLIFLLNSLFLHKTYVVVIIRNVLLRCFLQSNHYISRVERKTVVSQMVVFPKTWSPHHESVMKITTFLSVNNEYLGAIARMSNGT